MTEEEVKALLENLAELPGTTSGVAFGPRGGTSVGEVQAAVTADVEEQQLRLPPDFVARVLAALKHSHVRLMGAPGTGKSTIAQMIMRARKGDDFVFALATGQWTGEDIIGGPMPHEDDPNTLVFRPGLVLEAAEADRWVGIDEINRADIDAAFGELFSLLAGFDTTLPYRAEPGSDARVKIYATRPSGTLGRGEYGLPGDWRMLATMNSWDKTSLSRVSFAFSRRWCTVYVPVPSPDEYRDILDDFVSSAPNVDTAEIRAALRRLFVDEEAEPRSLRSLNLALGPGLAKSCVADMKATRSEGLGHADAFAHAVEGFLLPQFEGQLETHDAIAAALDDAAALAQVPPDRREELQARLGVFTGRTDVGVY